MVTDDLFFQAHLENMAFDLNITPPVLYGEEAKRAAKIYGSLDHGAYLWKNNENTVALKNKDSIATAAHEMRHAWQHKHNPERFKYEVPTKQNRFRNFFGRLWYFATYFFNRKEIDADKFAADYCKRNRLTLDLKAVKKRICISKAGRIVFIIFLFVLTCALVDLAYVLFVYSRFKWNF